VEKRDLQAFGKTRERLPGIGFTGKRGPAQRPEDFDCLVTLLAPLPIDGALGLRLAMCRVKEDPALLDAPIARAYHLIAIALRQRSHRLWVGLGQDGVSFAQGRWDAGKPLEVSVGQLLQVLGTIEGTVSDKECHARGELQLSHMIGDDLAEVVRVTTIATEGLHQHGDIGLVFDYQVQHDLVKVRALSPTVAVGDMNDVLLRLLVTILAAINMEARAIEVGKAGRQSQALGSGRGNEAGEFGHPNFVEHIQGSSERVIVEMTGLNTQNRHPVAIT
jgi:hypothetical protein